MLRLKELRQSKGLTQSKLADKLGVSRSTIAMYETSGSEPDLTTLSKLASIFGVSIDYLMGEDEGATKSNGVKIPVLGVIPAGIPIEAVEDIIDYEEISQDMAKHGNYFALKVRGNSMQPVINEGDVIIVKQQNDADSGKICVVMISDNDATLKEIKKDPSGLWVLPKNPYSDFQPTYFTNKEIIEKPVRILGVAVEIRRSL